MTNIRKWEHNEKWVQIDLDLCTGVAACEDTCPAGVYSLRTGKVNAENIGECIQCLACQDLCPHNAIIDHFAW